ncbi:MAG TPA: Crp/Fnr family transcriptional regulator [Acetobacteraceae bacterium]|nr:Crp/Fnr family transcriptional regulator [Acetobacteraceae bacterium]
MEAALDTQTEHPATPAGPRARVLRGNPLFAGLPEADLEALATGARERTMSRGEVLFRRGDPGGFLLAVLAGEVRIALTGAAGRDQVLRILKAGEIFGEIALLDGRPRSADATAMTNGRLLVLDRRDLLARMQRDPDLALRIIAVLCDRLRATSAQLEGMLFHDSATRLAASLLGMTAGRAVPRLDITQGALGEIIGATRETVNKKLREWEEAGWVSLTPGRVTITDAKALAALLPEGAAAEAL